MIVHKDDRRSRKLERALHHLTHIDRRVIHRPLALHFVGDELVLLVEEENAKLFTLLVALHGAQIAQHLIP